MIGPREAKDDRAAVAVVLGAHDARRSVLSGSLVLDRSTIQVLDPRAVPSVAARQRSHLDRAVRCAAEHQRHQRCQEHD